MSAAAVRSLNTTRRGLVSGPARRTVDGRISTDPSEDPLVMSATKLAQWIRDGRLSAREAVELHIARIDAANPAINAVVARCFERALDEADLADTARAAGRLLGPLHGVPMTIKDSFDAEGVISTGGTLGRRGFVPHRDATVLGRVRAAGAILLGKTNTPEFTLGGGWKGTDNLVYGLTRNPYDPDHQPGASSGGSAAIVAAGGAAFDIGSDFGGSLRGPAHACGLAAIKPTQGRCSRAGHIIGYGGLYDSFQQIGPIARRVEDMALVLPLISGPDGLDAALIPAPLGDPDDVALNGLRVALAIGSGATSPPLEIQGLLRKAAGWLEEAGCHIVEDTPPKVAEMSRARAAFSGAPGADPMRRLLARHGTTQASPGLNLDGEEAPSGDLTRFAEELDAIRGEQLFWFQKYDLILCAAGSGPALRVDIDPATPMTAPRGGGLSLMGTFNANGWPAGVVRVAAASANPRLPLGLQVAGRPWREDQVIAALARIERRSGGYQPPEMFS